MDPFLTAVRQTLASRLLCDARTRFLVAVSGGPDSVALLAALTDLGWEVTVAHFNHGWRGRESERDEAFVVALAERLGVECVVGRAREMTRPLPDPPPQAGEGVHGRGQGGKEQMARQERYAFLLDCARQSDCACIATGHTRDDQAETVLLRALRGSGATGLAGIQPRRADGVVRPLIDVGRGDVLAYLRRRDLGFVEDSSNADRRFARNRLRLDVMPALQQLEPGAVGRLAALADEMAAAAEVERALAEEILRQATDAAGDLVWAPLQSRAPALRHLAARAWLGRRRGHLRRLGAAHFAAVASCGRSGTRVELPHGEAVVNEHGVLRFLPRARAEEDVAPIPLGLDAEIRFGTYRVAAALFAGDRRAASLDEALLDGDCVHLPLQVRAWRAGDRLQPLGMQGHRKLSDVFIDAKLPRWQRRSLPIVVSGEDILWVPGVVRAAHAALGAGTRRVIRLVAGRGRSSG